MPTDDGGTLTRGQPARPDDGALLLSEGRHARLHHRGEGLPRRAAGIHRAPASPSSASPPTPIASHRKFKAKHGLNFPLASDTDKAAWPRRSACGWRRACTARSTWAWSARPCSSIGKGVVRRVWRKVKVAGHVAEVLRRRAAGSSSPAQARAGTRGVSVRPRRRPAAGGGMTAMRRPALRAGADSDTRSHKGRRRANVRPRRKHPSAGSDDSIVRTGERHVSQRNRQARRSRASSTASSRPNWRASSATPTIR